MTNHLGVPDYARDEWEALGAALAALQMPTPCRGARRDDWSADGRGDAAAVAADACLDCPVFQQCGTYAVAAGERHGVWGGMTAGARTTARKGANR